MADQNAKRDANNTSTMLAMTAGGETIRVVANADGTIGGGGGAATIANGADVTQGSTTDAAVDTDATGTISGKLRGLVKILAARLPVALGDGGGVKVDGTGIALPVDTELPVAAVLADNMANPTTTVLGSCSLIRRVATNTWYSWTGGSGADAGDANGAIVQDAIVPYMLNLPYGMITGGTAARLRTPFVFKPLDAVSIAAETTIWDPAAGKKFRLMGYHLSSSVAGNVIIKDNTAGTTIAVIPSGAGGAGVCVNLGNGILSAVVDNVLTATGPAVSTLSGVVWGTEE